MKRLVTNPHRTLLTVIALALVSMASLVWAAPPDGVLDETHASVRAVMAVQGEVTPDLMKLEGILGTAVGLADSEELALVVFVDRDSAKMADLVRGLPPQIRGKAVKVELTDKFRAFKPGTGGKPTPQPTVDHKGLQTPPIKLGTSGGWRYDLANGYCCGGTLGSLVKIGNVKYILSNYHVLEADIVNGGNSRVATAGDPVIQPGLIDAGCNQNNAQNVATLSGIKSLYLDPASGKVIGNVDAAIAEVSYYTDANGSHPMVSEDGAILGIGTISSTTIPPDLNKAVKKSGRTTGLTRSTISGLNATVSVAYENECAGTGAFTKQFTGQIIMANKGSKFLNSGDSGSLMVEDVITDPKAIGLLFAGSNTSAIANPIGQVLSFFGATMVGSPDF